MPFYTWRGVDIHWNYSKGSLFAMSQESLDQRLLKKGIALLYCRQARSWRLFRSKNSWADDIQYFRQLAVLVDAGVLLPQALFIVAEQTQKPFFKEIAFDVAGQVDGGQSVTQALSAYPNVFSQITVQLIKAGEESGDLARALDQLCAHIESTQSFYARLRSALMMPAMTLGFFILVVSILFTVVLPRFADIFNSLGKEVPPFTRYMLNVSAYLQAGGLVHLGLILIIVALALLFCARTHKAKLLGQRALLALPIVGPLLKIRFVSYFLHSFALLLDGGVPLVLALDIIGQTVSGQFKAVVEGIQEDITAGQPLIQAFEKSGKGLFQPDLVAMVEVGQETDRLAHLLKKVAHAYHNKLMERLLVGTTLIQPLLMIVLGLLVTFLVFSVYVPLLSLGDAI